MRKGVYIQTRFQVCGICGKRHAPTHKFPFLAEYGIKGKYAARECLGKLPRPDMTNVTFFPAPRLPASAEGEEWQREEPPRSRSPS
jgi:hypothetical protein